ncbi:unnamed protein product [Closterium sp. Naga37s-1]|nr:unnamed protein product [Closterium sp. Naga37s-1]
MSSKPSPVLSHANEASDNCPACAVPSLPFPLRRKGRYLWSRCVEGRAAPTRLHFPSPCLPPSVFSLLCSPVLDIHHQLLRRAVVAVCRDSFARVIASLDTAGGCGEIREPGRSPSLLSSTYRPPLLPHVFTRHSPPPRLLQRNVQLVACVAAPLVGDLLDSAPRVPILRAILVSQSTAIMVGAAATMHALHLAFPNAAAAAVAGTAGTSALCALPAAAVLQQGWFVVVVVAGAVERLMGLATGVAVEIDWVLVLVGEDRPVLMAMAMATLGRVELLCEVAHLLFTSPYSVASAHSHLHPFRFPLSLLAVPILQVAGAFIFGALIATYGPLVWVGMAVIGAFSSAGAAMGFAASFMSPALVAHLGILQAGSIALLFQATLLALSVLDFSSLHLCPSFLYQCLLMLFLMLLVLSRMGQGVYQIVACQIIQAVPAASANLFGTTEMALGSLAELAMLTLAIVFHDPKYFGALVLMSLAGVVAAAVLYFSWLAFPDHRLQMLFPNQPNVQWRSVLWGEMGQGEKTKGKGFAG